MSTKHTTTQTIYPTARDGFLDDAARWEATKLDICEFIERTVTNAGAEGVVVPMSGGIDSTLTTALAVEALGNDRVLGLGLPALKTDSRNAAEARTIAEGLGIEFREMQLQPIVAAFEEAMASMAPNENDVSALGNVVARSRMICAYYVANTQSRLVCGTANRSELLLGYFTKYGDGGADLYPLGDLYKSDVRSLSQHIGLPRRIITKDPTAGLLADQTDEDDLGATYDVIDPFLRRLAEADHNACVEEVADGLAIDFETAEQIASMYADSVHKRTLPPRPGLETAGEMRSSSPEHAGSLVN
ncbi:NAD+ synthase [Halostagnicola sp. A-GB9-2]|uniref:NAD+ synthase n=1 Tax=Halostagnicola sp. A-GB9-2 TaxID=3048066 RepID=UPI0024BF2E11|nr:NAD+ synthase [Halostagnicola sp. A-GB9-2]MDJ1434043.1 NAD+ synthase [Halostagnicola sp. A-GB9-2]